jgi:general stress protein 26
MEFTMQELIESTQHSNVTDRHAIFAAAREIMNLQKYCALVTIDSSGQPQIRTMNPFPPDDDMSVWFATNNRCRKVQEIQNHPQVSLYYADHNDPSGYVVLSGKAILVDEISEKLKRKRDYWEKAFPDWNYLMLIKIIPEKLEVLNYKSGFLNDLVTWRTPSIEFGNQ